MGKLYLYILIGKLLIVGLIFISFTHGYPHGFRDLMDLDDADGYWLEDNYQEDSPIEKATLPEDGEMFEGDIVMDQRIRDAVLGAADRKRSALVDDSEKIWPKGIVPYEFHDSMPSDIKTDVARAIRDMASYTCVQFVKRKDEEDYVTFRSIPTKCSSLVGRKGGQQNITIGEGCTREGTILHEMMHVLGIIHEQSRPDRDEHVIVVRENIEKKYLHNFHKYDFRRVQNLDTPYNFASIMHYRNDAFSKNDKPTLVAKEESTLKFGQRSFFSQGDIHQINQLYHCGDKQDTINTKNTVNMLYETIADTSDHPSGDDPRIVRDYY